MKNKDLSNNFELREFLLSDTAVQLGVESTQYYPPYDVEENLEYLAEYTLQPARYFLDYGFTINSGWRCKAVNDEVGSTDASQHLKGEAADVSISDRMLTTERKSTIHAIAELRRRIKRVTGVMPREDVNADYYLWAYFCLHLDELDIDQVIHEYGSDGSPSWVHVSSSDRQDRRRMTIKRKGKRYTDLSLSKALMLGC